MENSNNQNQSRFLLAAGLSILIFFGWSYFFAPKKAPEPSANTAEPQAASTPAAETAASPAPAAQTAPLPADTANNPHRVITIKSPLYEVKLDAKGAVASSWVLIKNSSSKGDRVLWADASLNGPDKPLQLISPDGAERSPRELPFRLLSADPTLDNLANNTNYEISTTEDSIELKPGEERTIDFTLTGGGIEIKKSFLFRADNFVSDLGLTLKKDGQPVPAKIAVGPSIGDQGIKVHNFYHIESEAIGIVAADDERYNGTHFTYVNNEATKQFEGNADWAGVADTYFAMVAVPAAPSPGLEYRATKWEQPVEPYHDGIIAFITRRESTTRVRHLVTAFVPVTTDGTPTRIYTGTKDYFTLGDYGPVVSEQVGRPIDLRDLINYGWLSFVARPLAPPMLYALHYINLVVHNYGVAIIVFTMLFYSLLFPLRWSQSKSFKKAAGNAPKMKEIQDQIKALQKKGVATDDPRMRDLQMQQLRLTKDALPIGGCLPMLLQFPLLIALYVAVTISLDFRQATFLWLPDLSAGDPFHILEFAFAISMALSMKFTPTAPAVSPEQQMQQKMMTYFMPVMMLWVMWAAPAGLLLYWFFGNIVSFGQQMLINRMNRPTEPPTTTVVESVPKNAKKIKAKLNEA